ncbi:hypothetical protein GGF41_002803 [Coemansia sp. RSA 2531]|nr:hypothetical protein GGF41_002803 [Coemansia sp. RSA 2531]
MVGSWRQCSSTIRSWAWPTTLILRHQLVLLTLLWLRAAMTTTMRDDGQPKVDEQGRLIVDITKQHVIDGLSTVLKAYVEARAVVWPLLSGFYSKTLTKHLESKHKIHKDERHVVHSYPLHRKQRLSAYINQQQADYRLARNMRAALGKDADYRGGQLVGVHDQIPRAYTRDELARSIQTIRGFGLLD